jgi:hypothetical protein
MITTARSRAADRFAADRLREQFGPVLSSTGSIATSGCRSRSIAIPRPRSTR